MSPPTEKADTPVAAMDAKLMVATGSGDVQQLKNLVKQQAERPHPQQGNMNAHLLALASSGSSGGLQTLLNGGDGQPSSNDGTTNQDTEANTSILEVVNAEGDIVDTALHVVAAYGQGDNFFIRSREAKHLVQQNNKWWWWRWRRLTLTQRNALLTSYGYGDGENFLESASIIYGKAKHLLFAQNSNGDTPLHCAARAGKSNMVKCLIHLARDAGGEGRMKELLRKENKRKETALHEAVRIGDKDIVDLLMGKDSELASFPEDGGASPMYLGIVLKRDEIVKILYDKSSPGKLSFAGPNRQNALHAAVLRYPNKYRHRDLTKLLEWNEKHLCPQKKNLTTQRDENGSTPLHFAAAIKFWIKFRPSSICRQVLEANTDALYQPDNGGFFPIHVAASVGASKNVYMFVTKFPGSAGLRDAKGRTFLHVAVEKKKTNVIKSACRNLSLSWIMNMVDNDGNTALHLSVEAGSLEMFCPLVGNPQVNLNIPNNRGGTPLDIAEYKFPKDGMLYYSQNSEVQIRTALRIAGAVEGARRQDPLLDDNTTVGVKAHDGSKIVEVLKDSTQALCIGSVLITTVTFGATSAAPGGYIADDHNHGGSPILAPRYAFDAFIVANTLAFVFSAMATVGLMYSGTPLLNPRSRKIYLVIAVNLLYNSLTSLAAAFALGAYVVLAPVTHKTAIATCVLTSLGLLCRKLEFIWTRYILLQPLCTRRGLIWALGYSANLIMRNMLFENWPLVFIFGWAAHAKPSHIIEAAAEAPASLLA